MQLELVPPPKPAKIPATGANVDKKKKEGEEDEATLFPGNFVDQASLTFRHLHSSPDYVDFSGEEGYGRFIDLHEQHEQYMNLKGATPREYIQYLKTFDQLFEYPRANKSHSQYRR